MENQKTRGLNRHSTMGGKTRKAERRAGAFARKAEWDKLSLKQKLAHLPLGGAKRQRARLEAQIANQAEKQKEGDKQKRKKEAKDPVDAVEGN